MIKQLKRDGRIRIEPSDVRYLRDSYARALIAERLLAKLGELRPDDVADDDFVLNKDRAGALVELKR